MSQLTEKQSLVLGLIIAGGITLDALSKESELSKQAIVPILSALLAKNLIAKSDDGLYTPVVSENVNDDVIETVQTPINDASTTTVTPTEVENPEGLNEVKSKNNIVTLLIPYLKSEAAGEELKYALRSWAKNFKEVVRVIIVGDREDWFAPDIVHIPHEPHLITEVCNCPVPSQIRNPQADVTHKILTAITAERIEGSFILSNDDIFLLGQTSVADIESLKAFFIDLEKTGEGKGLYAQNNRLTADVLRSNHLPTVRYGTHTPIALDASKLVDVIEKYNATEHGYPIESLYYNEECPNARPILLDGAANDPVLASVYKSEINQDILSKALSTRKFLNCDSKGWVAVEPHLKAMFPEPSPFEI